MWKASGMFPERKAGQAGPEGMPRQELWLGGGSEPEQWWRLSRTLKKKKKNLTAQRSLPPTHTPAPHRKTPFSDGGKLSLLSQSNQCPTQTPGNRYETEQLVLGWVGPGEGSSGSGARSLSQPPSPAPAKPQAQPPSGSHPWKRVQERKRAVSTLTPQTQRWKLCFPPGGWSMQEN